MAVVPFRNSGEGTFSLVLPYSYSDSAEGKRRRQGGGEVNSVRGRACRSLGELHPFSGSAGAHLPRAAQALLGPTCAVRAASPARRLPARRGAGTCASALCAPRG